MPTVHCARINLDAYDAAGRMNSVASPAGPTTYGYLAASHQGDNYASERRTLIDYPGVLQIDQDFTDLPKRFTVPTTSAGPNLTNLWDTTGRLTETKLVNGGTTFNRHAYVLNAAHQRTKQTRPDASYVDYTYDDAGQLSTALSYYSGGSPITTEQLKGTSGNPNFPGQRFQRHEI